MLSLSLQTFNVFAEKSVKLNENIWEFKIVYGKVCKFELVCQTVVMLKIKLNSHHKN